MTKIFDFALEIKGGGREGGTCEVLRPCHPPKIWNVHQSGHQGRFKALSRHSSFASSKVDYSVGEHLYMLPSDMTLKIRPGTVGYNNKILVSNGKFILGKNEKVNLAVPALKSHKTNSLETPAIKNHKTNSSETPAIESHSNTAQGLTHTPTISHEDEKAAFILFITGGFTVWFLFQ